MQIIYLFIKYNERILAVFRMRTVKNANERVVRSKGVPCCVQFNSE